MYSIPSAQEYNGSWRTSFWRLPSTTLQERAPAAAHTNAQAKGTHIQDQLRYSTGFSTYPNPGPADIIRRRQIGQIRVLPWISDQDPKLGFLFQAFE